MTDEVAFDEEEEEEEDKDDIQDLAIEETSANDPPEAFPPGFFLEKFQGLRRLPEPTNGEETPATTEVPTNEPAAISEEEKMASESVEEEEASVEPVETTEVTDEEEEASPEPEVAIPIDEAVVEVGPVKPFPIATIEGDPATGISHISHHEWASAMFHQPVYVFAYHQPDSYGYHYYF